MPSSLVASVLPADISPTPVHASGMMALRNAAKGQFALQLQKAAGGTASFNFESNGDLPLSAIDTFRAGAIVRVIQRSDQISGLAGTDTSYLSDVTFGPKFADLTIGNRRCMWMESDCFLAATGTPTGQVYYMRASGVSSLNVVQNAMTVMQVIQVHNAAFVNMFTSKASWRGCAFCADAVSIPNIIPNTKIFCEFMRNSAAIGGGGYTVECSDGFRMANANGWAETSPIVLTYITGPNGTYLGQNEDIRSTSAHTAGTNQAAEFFIGRHENSLPPTDPGLNEAMGMSELATLVWNQTLSLQQAARVRASLYDLCGINPLHSHSNAPLVLVFTDSVWAGYKADDLRGWDKRVMTQVSPKVRWANFAMPGASIIPNPNITYPNNVLGWMPNWISQAIRQHKGRVHCIWGAPINDFYDGTITDQFVYDNGVVPLINAIRSVDPAAAITICTATKTSTSSLDAHFEASSTLIRNGAAANNYSVVELRNDPIMGTYNSTIYKDAVHPTNAGHDRMATLIQPRIQSWLTSIGVS